MIIRTTKGILMEMVEQPIPDFTNPIKQSFDLYSEIKWVRVVDELREWKNLYNALIKLRALKSEDIQILEAVVRNHINELSGGV